MKTNLIRGSAAVWLLALAVAAAGALGCKDSSPGTGRTVPPSAAEWQRAPQADSKPDPPHPSGRGRGRGEGADKQTVDHERGPSPNLPRGVPAKVGMVLKYIDEHKRAPENYEGGRTFGNFEGLLPKEDADGKPIKYREWDVNPKVPGKNRGPERLVTGSDGSAYYTPDHYKSFIKIR
jgi:guanyl-specific ribonuclease Sa